MFWVMSKWAETGGEGGGSLFRLESHHLTRQEALAAVDSFLESTGSSACVVVVELKQMMEKNRS